MRKAQIGWSPSRTQGRAERGLLGLSENKNLDPFPTSESILTNVLGEGKSNIHFTSPFPWPQACCSQDSTVPSGQVLWQGPASMLVPARPEQCFKVGMSLLCQTRPGFARQRVPPRARPPGKEAGPQNRSVSLPLGALALGPEVAQEETSQTEGHVERTYVENWEAQDPGCLGRFPSKLVKLGKAGGEGSRKSQNLRTGEPQAQEQSSRPGPVIQQM